MDDELQKLDDRVTNLHNINLKLANDINKLGANVDLAGARIEHLAGFLVELEILTQEQSLTEQEDWELSLREQLKSFRDRLLANAGHARKVPKKKIWTPGDN